MGSRRIMVIGIDGGTLDLIEPWTREGKLPVLSRFMAEGAIGELKSTIPAHSAPAWSSFITGKNPGKHGIFDFTRHRSGSYQLSFVNGSHRSGKSVWRILSDNGKSAGVMHVPLTFPPEEINGFMISGMDSPGVTSGFTYPRQLYQEIVDNVGDYILEPDLWALISKGHMEEAIERMYGAVERRCAVASYLLEKHPTDFFMMVFTDTDRAQHAFWKYMDPRHLLYSSEEAESIRSAILGAYQRVDRAIGELIDRAGEETTVILMSDHGAGYMSHKTLYLNNWLSRKGLLRYKDVGSAGECRGVLSGLKQFAYTKLSSQWPRKLWRRIPKGVKYQIKKFGWFPAFRNRMASQFFYSRIDMARTRAYAEESRGFIWVNLKGRDLLGTVEPGDEYAQLCRYIQSELQGLKDPDNGAPVISGVFRKDEIYYGEEIYKAPDIVISFEDGDYVLRPSYYGDDGIAIKSLDRDELAKIESEAHSNSRHLPDGVFMIKGPDVKKGGRIKDARIIDLAPTILYLMGVAVPEDMDGVALTDCLEPGFLADNPVTFGSVDKTTADSAGQDYSDEDEDAIRARLTSLGYLD